MDRVDETEQEDVTVQEAVTERFERIVTATNSLTNDFYPPPYVEFKIKSVMENLKLINKMTGEMLQLLVLAILKTQSDDDRELEE